MTNAILPGDNRAPKTVRSGIDDLADLAVFDDSIQPKSKPTKPVLVSPFDSLLV